jgi:hypothetical protein
MSLVTSLAARAAQLALVGPAIARMKKRAIRAAIGGVLIALFGLLGLVYLLMALRTELDRHLGAVWSPVAIGAGLLAIAGVAYLVFLRPRASEGEAAASQAEAMRDTIVGPARKLEGQVAKNPLQSLAVALAVGFAAASLLRLLRGRQDQAARRGYDGTGVPPGEPPPPPQRPPWMREVVLRETERRKGNGRGA